MLISKDLLIFSWYFFNRLYGNHDKSNSSAVKLIPLLFWHFKYCWQGDDVVKKHPNIKENKKWP